jgi:L-lactate permease
VAVNNVVAAGATVGISGEEGRVIRVNFWPLVGFLGLVVVVGGVIWWVGS